MAASAVPSSTTESLVQPRSSKTLIFMPVCLYRDVGVKAIENLMEKKGKFDYILLETTGLADPGPIASMFWLDDELGSDIYLDGNIIVIAI